MRPSLLLGLLLGVAACSPVQVAASKSAASSGPDVVAAVDTAPPQAPFGTPKPDPATVAFVRAFLDATVVRCVPGMKGLVRCPLCDKAGNAVVGGRLRLDPSRTAACLTAAREAPCGPIAETFLWTVVGSADALSMVPACRTALAGSRGPGEGCREVREKSLFIEECAEGHFCDRTKRTGCESTCMPRLAEGAACVQRSDGQCGPGLGCQRGKCTALRRKPHGAACTADDQCLDRCIEGRCVTAGLDGARCGGDQDCAGDLRCDAATSRCITRQGLAGTCSSTRDCSWGRACIAGQCAVRLGGGTACDADDACADSLRCVGGTCATPSRRGGRCDDADDCADVDARCLALSPDAATVCHVGVVPLGASCELDALCGPEGRCRGEAGGRSICVPRLPVGTSCAQPNDCHDDLCVDDRCVAPAAAGGQCIDDRGCQSGLACAEGLCVPLGGAGQACAGSNLCAPSLVCGAEGTCVPRASVGAACVPLGCEDGLTCFDGVCVLTPCTE
jgi:hypothetical protein